MNVILDMDGVMVDFMGALHKALNLPYSEAAHPYPKRTYEMLAMVAERAGIPEAEVYKICDGREFWASMEWTKEGKELVALVRKNIGDRNIFICTSPMPRGDAWAGKVDWVQREVPWLSRSLVISSAPKHLLAKKDVILIDDKDKNVREFAQHGGIGFLVPRPWNSAESVMGRNWLSVLDGLLCHEPEVMR